MKYPVVRRLLLPTFLGIGFLSGGVWADTEIDLGDSAPAAKPTVVSTAKLADAAKPTPTTEISEAPTATPTAQKVAAFEEEEPTPTVAVIHGTVKMKDYYNAGIKNYQDQDYEAAIRYLKKALEMDDPYSQKFYYAEAAAMLGVIYQFRIIHNDKALHYYKLALKYEKGNRTAKKHLKEVQRLIARGE